MDVHHKPTEHVLEKDVSTEEDNLQTAATSYQHTEDDRTADARPLDEADMPKGYYYSPTFIGTYIVSASRPTILSPLEKKTESKAFFGAIMAGVELTQKPGYRTRSLRWRRDVCTRCATPRYHQR